MCDDTTLSAEDQALAGKGLTRRDFAAMSAAAAIAACSGDKGEARQAAAGTLALAERAVRVTTPDGLCDAVFVHPARGAHPGVVMWPDISGSREAFRVMARRLAGAGHAVLLVNHYYRSAPAPLFETFAAGRTPEGQARLAPMIAAISPAGVMRDAAAFVGFLDAQAAVDKRRRIGSSGYCMTGPFAVRTAAAVPDRIGAVASLHGAGLVGSDANSANNLLARTQARYLFAFARGDDARDPAAKDTLRAAAAAAGRPAEIEVYPAEHGWTVPDTPAYDRAQADRAFARVVALYARL